MRLSRLIRVSFGSRLRCRPSCLPSCLPYPTHTPDGCTRLYTMPVGHEQESNRSRDRQEEKDANKMELML